MSVELATPPQVEFAPTKLPVSEPRALESVAATPRALGPFFRLAAIAPWLVRMLEPIATRVVPLVSKSVRDQTRLNALRIFGRELPPQEQQAFTREVVRNFYQLVYDIGRSSREPVERLLARIDRTYGEPEYKVMRRGGRGAVLVTAHMGSFEVGLAALMREEQRAHVVYKRDASEAFEDLRAKMRRVLGVIEAPIDHGLSTWMTLRDALLNGDVVVMQGDRAMPGQRSAVVPFLHGHLRVPTGAIRLARMTGSPIVPVFTVRIAPGQFAVHLYPAIEPGRSGEDPGPNDAAVREMCKAIESMVARYPTQWLALGAAFEEDAGHA